MFMYKNIGIGKFERFSTHSLYVRIRNINHRAEQNAMWVDDDITKSKYL